VSLPPILTAPTRRASLNFDQLRELSDDPEGRLQLLDAASPAESRCELISLSDDLLLSRSDCDHVPKDSSATAWSFDFQGWLFLHLRLDGISRELDGDGQEHLLGAHSFLLSASGQSGPPVRQVLGDNWRTVGIACRPSFVSRELGLADASLPGMVREFGRGTQPGFWYAGTMDAEMLEVARHLLRPPIAGRTRPIYLRAKTVELLCLALERLDSPKLLASSIKLNTRDVQCLHRARDLLNQTSEFPGLGELARAVGINRNKLSAGFKHLFGEPAAAYFRARQLDAARQRILDGEIGISRIADDAGYCDPGSFSKAFRQRFGVLPSELQAVQVLSSD